MRALLCNDLCNTTSSDVLKSKNLDLTKYSHAQVKSTNPNKCKRSNKVSK